MWKGGTTLQTDAANKAEQRGKLMSVDDFGDAPPQVTMHEIWGSCLSIHGWGPLANDMSS